MKRLFELGLTKEQVDLVLRARVFAIESHRAVNHYYGEDKVGYEFHLESAFNFAVDYIYLVPAKYRGAVLAAIWLHDVIEDCRVNYSKILEMFGDHVAEIVFALTNNKGRTRGARANDDYYKGIKEIPFADYCKICDRLANASYSESVIATHNIDRMYKKYKEENKSFVRKLWNPNLTDMYASLRIILDKEFQNAML